MLTIYFAVTILCMTCVQESISPAQQVAAVISALEKERNEYIEKLNKTSSTEQRNSLMLEAPSPIPHAEKMLAIAEKYPDSKASVEALLWIAKNTPGSPISKSTILAKTHELLLTRHLRDPRIGELAASLTWGVSADNETMLRRIQAGEIDDSVRGIVELSLVYQWISQMELLRFQRTRVEFAADSTARELFEKSLSEELGDETTSLLRTRTPESLHRMIIQSLEVLLKSEQSASGTWPLSVQRSSVAEVASQERNRLTTLDVGCRAPELDTVGLDGKNISLGAQKGRVVLLIFSGQWCAACRGLYAVERELSTELRHSPFTLMVVNSDPTIEAAKLLAKAEKMEWPIAWDGSPNGTIAQKWNVRSWPLIQIIDHHGVIRHQFNGAPDPDLLKAIVLRIVSEVEK